MDRAEVSQTLGLVGVITCVVQDLKSRKISNTINLTILIVGCLSVLMTGLMSGLSLWGLLQQIIFSISVAIIISIPVYLLKALGGGDIKLFIALSVYLNTNQVITLFIASLVWGTLLGLFKAILDKKYLTFFKNIRGLTMAIKPTEDQLTKIPFSVALLFGYLSVWVIQRQNGVFL